MNIRHVYPDVLKEWCPWVKEYNSYFEGTELRVEVFMTNKMRIVAVDCRGHQQMEGRKIF